MLPIWLFVLSGCALLPLHMSKSWTVRWHPILVCSYKPFATAHHVSAKLTAFADLKQLLMGAVLSGPTCSAVLLQAAARLPAIWSVAKLDAASPSSSPVTWQGKVQQVGSLFSNKEPKAFEALTPMQQARRIADIAMSIWLFAMAKHVELEQAAADVFWDAHTQPGNASCHKIS